MGIFGGKNCYFWGYFVVFMGYPKSLFGGNFLGVLLICSQQKRSFTSTNFSKPVMWPSIFCIYRLLAYRLLPSIIMATCLGNGPFFIISPNNFWDHVRLSSANHVIFFFFLLRQSMAKHNKLTVQSSSIIKNSKWPRYRPIFAVNSGNNYKTTRHKYKFVFIHSKI